MVISESGNMVTHGIKPSDLQPQSQALVPQESSLNNEQSLKDHTVSKQNSILSLTLDEIQFKSGKSFGSMNMDEFLASVWSVDETQQVPSSNPPNVEQSTHNSIEQMQQPTLTQQSSMSVPVPICKKTVDEVWFEIQKFEPEQVNPTNFSIRESPQRQQTFGEMTLEDFLIKAGVVQEAHSSSQQKMITKQPPTQNDNNCLDANYGMGHALIGLGFPSPQNANENMVVSNSYAPYQMFSQGNKTNVEESSNVAENEKDQTVIDPSGTKGKKRIIDGPPEVVVERRQRRMIKNRESAARSRARKQAYTVELELELNQLKEENEKLKQLLEEMDQKRKEELVNMKRKQSSTMAQKKSEKLRTLRRTASASW